jgi:2-oxoglutarate ferredoxin oxidoreductase subunit alpha
MTPVLLLTDGYLGNGSEPWKIPSVSELPEIKPPIAIKNDEPYYPYMRDEKRLSRSWAIPGTPGLEHRIGGLEKTDKGNVSYVPENHEYMVNIREEKVMRVAEKIPDLKVFGPESNDLLVVGWGGAYGHLLTAVRELQADGQKVSLANFNYIKPFPKNVRDVFKRFKKIIVCELNHGQFADYLRINFQEFTYNQFNKVQGIPFTINEIKEHCIKLLEEK